MRTTLYRGIDGKFLKFDENHYKVGNILTWPAFTSTTPNEDVVYNQFLGRAAQPIAFEIHGSFVGYDIKLFSRFLNENEVLLEPETTFRVVSIQDDIRNPKAKRIVVNVESTPLMIKEAVENFARAEVNLQQQQQRQQQQQTNVRWNPSPQPQFIQHQQQQLPPNWIRRIDSKTGRTYYANIITKRTQWEFPAF